MIRTNFSRYMVIAMDSECNNYPLPAIGKEVWV